MNPLLIKDVQAFLQAAEAGSLHAGARALGITQPALTKAVRRLESALGVHLFERSRKGVSLTPIGQMFRSRGVALDTLVRDIRMEIEDLRSGDAGLVRLGVVPAVVESVVAPTLAHFIDSRDALHFEMQVQLSSVLLRELQAGRLDLVVAALPAVPGPDLNFHVVGTTVSSVVVRRGHALTRRAFTVEDLASQKWLLPPGDITLTQWVVAMFRETGLAAPEIYVQADATPAVFAALVRNTSLLTVMTNEMLQSPMGTGLVPLPAPAMCWPLELALFWRRTAHFSAPMQRCRSALMEAFATSAAQAAQRGARARAG